ncbi:rhodanese-like domain-containing protein [Maribellus sp. YY47]|uniref:rhodanese-like domain-containing protein n=1 Tax=Maribellus sp. YY47 TaxID=2929486 RepID=UPI0020009267|nr:rhodanese-like domain-containing protein [Maribellus sp. YY47]MCK3682567.1 rhodanese-like domain-containing protein [Maribellus sp. YY47]
MHIHELNPWRTLIALSAFVVLLIVGFLTMHKPLLTYEKSMSESVAALEDSDAYFYPWQLEDVIGNKAGNIVLFDIRDNFVFGQGHIPGAENMSANNLTREENIERLKALRDNGTTVVLYGEDELHANGPWMLFRQVGFSNVKLLLGGYRYYFEHKDDLAATKNDDSYKKGIARFNYAEMAAPEDGTGVKHVAKQPVQVERRQKSNVAAGGC